MKWIKKKETVTKERDIKKFLFFPITIGYETRWLERATIHQILVHRIDVTCGASWYEWENKSFVK